MRVNRIPTLRGLGDDTQATLNAAQQALLAAGYTGAECHTETVGYPGGSYTQNVCSAPGYSGGTDASLVTKMTPAQLAAQRGYELNSGEGTPATLDYFQQTAGAPNIAITNSTAPAATPGANTPNSSLAPDWFGTLQSQLNNLSSQVATQSAPPATPASAPTTTGTSGSTTNTTNTTTSGSTSGGALGTSTIISGIPDIAVYAGGALLLVLLLKGK